MVTTKKMRMLVLERAEIRDFIAPILREEFGEVELLHTESQEEALAWFAEGQHFDFVFCDWEMGGKYFVQTVRTSGNCRNVPILVLTELQSDAVIAESFRQHVNDILPKPFLRKALQNKLRTINERLDRRRHVRIKPTEQSWVRLHLPEVDEFYLELIDIAVQGCQLRAPLEIYDVLRIYQPVEMEFEYEGEAISIECNVLRIEHDRLQPESRETVLLGLGFLAMGEEARRTLERMIDDTWIMG